MEIMHISRFQYSIQLHGVYAIVCMIQTLKIKLNWKQMIEKWEIFNVLKGRRANKSHAIYANN